MYLFAMNSLSCPLEKVICQRRNKKHRGPERTNFQGCFFSVDVVEFSIRMHEADTITNFFCTTMITEIRGWLLISYWNWKKKSAIIEALTKHCTTQITPCCIIRSTKCKTTSRRHRFLEFFFFFSNVLHDSDRVELYCLLVWEWRINVWSK
jgi:hypothetical protein